MQYVPRAHVTVEYENKESFSTHLLQQKKEKEHILEQGLLFSFSFYCNVLYIKISMYTTYKCFQK